MEFADAIATAERDAATARVSRAVAAAGSAVCEECSEPISIERRMAAPFARRCLCCQQSLERLERLTGMRTA